MWASIRVNEVNPVQPVPAASRSCPTARSTTGMRAISSTCTSSRSDAIRPVHRPSDINAFAQLVRSVRPPPAIHQYVTSSSPPATAAAPTARTAASARAARLSIDGTGGAEGIASVVVMSTVPVLPVPVPDEPVPPGAVPAEPSPTVPSPSRSPRRPPSASDGPRWWPYSPVAPASPVGGPSAARPIA